jgi:pyrimidine-specific ribonucleoside hydrolase
MSHTSNLGRFLVLLLTFSWCHAAVAQQPQVTDIIISTDLATGLNGGWRGGYSDIDDGLAVAMAYFSHQFKVHGVVVTFGNNYMQPELQVAKTLINNYMGARIPVVPGASIPFNNPPAQTLTSSSPLLCSGNEGVEFMHSLLKPPAPPPAPQPAPITVLAIGPLTDVACLLVEHPNDAKQIQQIVAIMCRAPNEAFSINGVNGLSDFNMRRDPAAVTWLLQNSAVPVTFMGFSVTSSDLITSQEVQTKFAGSSDLAKFFFTAANNWITQWNNTFKEQGFHPWDQNAVYYAMNPKAYICAPADFQIISCGPPYNQCAGQSSGWAGLCPSSSLPANACSVVMYSPQWVDELGEHAQLWLTPPAGAGRVNFCTAYAPGGQQQFRNAIFNVFPPSFGSKR